MLIKNTHTGVCHTDAFTLSGMTLRAFSGGSRPRGAGIVVEVGEGVTSVKPGDHVIPLYTAECGSVNSASPVKRTSVYRFARLRAKD